MSGDAPQSLQKWGHLSMSAHETLRSSGGMKTLGAIQNIHLKLEKHQILASQQGGAAPATLANPYLGGSVQNKVIYF